MAKLTPIAASKFRKVLEIAGYKCIRIEGDHFVYSKAGATRPLVIPNWKQIPVFIIKNNLRTAGITREEYFSMLDKVWDYKAQIISTWKIKNSDEYILFSHNC